MPVKRLSDSVPPSVRLQGFKTWIEISARNAAHNFSVFRKLIGPRPKMLAVVKSNAYGHGLVLFSKLAQRMGIDGFCVDAPVEALRLRKEGITKPILVLGATLPQFLGKTAAGNIAITVSNFEGLSLLLKAKRPPKFHIKIDTGMCRQGFYPKEIPRAARMIRKKKGAASALEGCYTHFASAKDINYPTYTERQFSVFRDALGTLAARLHRSPSSLTAHCAATGGTLMNPKYHCDAVRLGIGLYGLWPSLELEVQLRRSGPDGSTAESRSPGLGASGLSRIALRPILSWRTVVGEVKTGRPGDFVGYDLTERISRKTKIAVLPVGYWHGFPRSLSGCGMVLLRGKRAKVLGRVSMDLVVVDVGNRPAAVGDPATIIGSDGGETLSAADVARLAGTSHYELITRINPLIERIAA